MGRETLLRLAGGCAAASPALLLSSDEPSRAVPALGSTAPPLLAPAPRQLLLVCYRSNPTHQLDMCSPCRSMEGATLSGRQCAYKILEDADKLAAAAAAAKQQQQAVAA